MIAEKIIKSGGIVVGVRWNEKFSAEHCIISKIEEIEQLRGSKYVQSNSNNIYKEIKKNLESNRNVLFSGTPCQNHALRQFLKKNYFNLYQIDVICHGVPSQEMLNRHLEEVNISKEKIKNIKFRYKEPYWDYSFVRIEYNNKIYQKLTIDDSYFNLFNIGYSLRESCHNCKYTSVNRHSDITLADFWGYKPKSFKMRDYQKGVNLILINSEKGEKLFKLIKENIIWEEATLEEAKRGNKCLKEPFVVEENRKKLFWENYQKGDSIKKLEEEFVGKPFKFPRLQNLRRIKNKFSWLIYRGN